MADVARHRIAVRRDVTAVRERIERVLGVTTTARPEGEWWGIYFEAPSDVCLDFLRPDVLPPLNWSPPKPTMEQFRNWRNWDGAA